MHCGLASKLWLVLDALWTGVKALTGVGCIVDWRQSVESYRELVT